MTCYAFVINKNASLLMSNENVSFDTVINETTLQSTVLYNVCTYVV